jgi:regulatory protein
VAAKNSKPAEENVEALKYGEKLLSICPRTESSLRTRLLRKGFSEASCDAAVAFLKERRILDDIAFAREWVEAKASEGPVGELLVRERLSEKGISGGTLDKVIAELGLAFREEESVREIVKKMSGRSKGRNPSGKERMKIYRYAVSRGFDPELAAETIRTILGDEDRHAGG